MRSNYSLSRCPVMEEPLNYVTYHLNNQKNVSIPNPFSIVFVLFTKSIKVHSDSGLNLGTR